MKYESGWEGNGSVRKYPSSRCTYLDCARGTSMLDAGDRRRVRGGKQLHCNTVRNTKADSFSVETSQSFITATRRGCGLDRRVAGRSLAMLAVRSDGMAHGTATLTILFRTKQLLNAVDGMVAVQLGSVRALLEWSLGLTL